MKRLTFFIIGIVAISIAASSCKKEKLDFSADKEIIEDYSFAEQAFNDINAQADEGSLNALSRYQALCASVSLDTSVNPRKITIDFGPTNCLCKDLRYRRGKVIATFTGKYMDSGTIITITPSDYFVNDHKITGTRTVSNNGTNAQGFLSFSISENGVITKPSGDSFTWSSNRTRQWVAGKGTLIWTDDEYLISGNANGTTSSGTSWTANITKPLRIKGNCRYVTEGTLVYKPGNQDDRTIDYGDGSCSAEGTFKVKSFSGTFVKR